MNRFSVCGFEGMWKDNARVAQLVEYNLAKVGVAGSNPVCRSQYLNFILIVHWEQSYATVAQLVEHNLAKVGVAGSSPVVRSNYLTRF